MNGTKRRRLAPLWASAAILASFIAGGNAAVAEEITVVLVEEPDTLDPCEITKRNTAMIVRENIIETITELDRVNGGVKSRLAESWERVDANTWRFKLREGIVFHDGLPLNADAVVANFNRMMNPNISCSDRVLYFENLQAVVTAVDEYTFEIKTPQPVPTMPVLMTMFGIPSPTTEKEALVRVPIGTGPYKFVEWQSGQYVTVEQDPNYWGEKGPVTKATYLFREDPTVRAAMVATGEADITPLIAPQDATNPETDFSYMNSETMVLRFDIGKPPLDDIRVRQAVDYAIDPELLIGTVYSPRWVLAKNLVMPTIAGANPDVLEYEYDPDKARQLIDEARADGVPVDDEVLLIVSNTLLGGFEGPTVIVEMLNEVGLNVRLQILESADYYNFAYKPFASGQPVHIFAEFHDNNTGDAGTTLANKYLSTGGMAKVNDAELDRLITTGLAAEEPQRSELFKQAFQRVRELSVDVVLFHMVADTRVGTRINFQPTAATSGELQLGQITFKE